MSGTGPGDDLTILIVSFVEEVKPFFAGIRRGVAGVFAVPRDAQAIAAARGSLGTLASSAKVLDFPVAWQLAELAQLLVEAFEASERGGVPDESQAPMLAMVDHLEAQLDGMEGGNDRGRERLDNAYRLLEQVLQTVEQAEAAPPPVMEIALDDLLLTLQPATPAPARVEMPIAPLLPEPIAPEPSQTELILLSAEDVAPIEWGEKEAILWNKGGWDESKTAYGNTEWIFLDEEDVTTVAAAPADDRLVETTATAPLLNQAYAEGDTEGADTAIDLAASATAELAPLPEITAALGPSGEPPEQDGMDELVFLDDMRGPGPEAALDLLPEANEALSEQHDTLITTASLGEFDQTAVPEAVATEQSDTLITTASLGAFADAAPTEPAAAHAATSGQGNDSLDAEALEEAALLALTPDDLEAYLALEGEAQHEFLRARLSEMADFATDLGIAVAPEAVGRRDTGDLTTLLGTPVSDTGRLPAVDTATGRLAATTDALIAPVAIRSTKRPRRARRTLLTPNHEGTDRLLAERAPDRTTGATDARDGATPHAPQETPGDGPTAEAEHDQLLHLALANDDAPTAAAESTAEVTGDVQVAAVGDLLLAEYRPADHGTGALRHGTSDLSGALEEAEDLRAERLATDRLSLHDGDSAGGDEGEDGFLDALLDDEPGLNSQQQQQLVDASDELFAEGGDDLDPNFAALPDVAPEIEAAFAQLSEADINTFLTLDGEAALAFLQSKAVGEATQQDAPVTLALPQDDAATPLAAAADTWASDGDAELPGLSDLGIDQEILEVFLQEAQELVVEWERTATGLRRAPADHAVMADLRRVAHTLKGAANMMGFAMLGAAGWRVEHLLDLLNERGLSVALPVLDFIDRTFALVRRLSADATADPQAFTAESAALEEQEGRLAAEIESQAPGAAAYGDDLDFVIAPTMASADEGLGASEVDELVDGELLEVFVQEAEDHLGGFNRALVALDRRPADGEQLAKAKRVVHTLKGAAASLGYPVTAALCHSIEDLFSTLDESGREPSREMLTLFFESAEALEALVAGITAGRGEDAARADALRARYAAFLGTTVGGLGRAPQAEPTPQPEDFVRSIEHGPRSVRVDIAHLDNLLNLVGELVINRTGQEQHLEKLGRTVAELLLSVERLRRVGGQLESRYEVAELLRGEDSRAVAPAPSGARPHLTLVGPVAPTAPVEDEFDSLEMDRYTELHRISRELIEIAADINAAGTELDGLYDSFDQNLSRQGRIATDLQDRMMEVRLVPLSTIAARLYRAVRGVATRRGRLTELVITGEAVEIDKVLLEEITDPLLHLVRNAADHGIESPDDRRRRGKVEGGTIHLSAAREGNEAVIRVQDDGAGIDIERVLDKALARGIIRRRDGLTREQALDLIFLPGFSTSATVNDISGRGVGLDVVRTNVTRLKGTIDVDSTVGVGTTFTIRLPIMLAVTRALLVRSGAQTFAIPLPVVEQVAFFRKELVSTIGGNELFDLAGATYPVVHLNRALGVAAGEIAGSARALIVGNADRRIALVVDELVGQQEIVVKRLGRHLQSVAGVAGATILGSGQVVLILNVLDLVGARRSVRGGEAAAATPLPLRPPTAPPQGLPGKRGEGRVAMVVDDSLSVRRVLTRTLERDGWQVLGAKDGVEALEMLAWARPQVLILDIEMPRMDGYELTSLLRTHPDHQELPIAMLTSRAGEKHRRKALELGVSAYLVKPFEEAELLRTVRELGATVRRQTVG